MRYRVTLIEGDGIGPEVTAATAEVLEAAGAPIEWEKMPGGLRAFEAFGEPMPRPTLDSILRNKVGLKGPLATPKGGGYRSANVALRKTLDLFVGWRPVRSLPSLVTRHHGVDLVVLRENTQDLYAGIEHEITPGTVVTLKVSTAEAGRRIAAWAFEYARTQGRRRVTVVHKRSVLPRTDGAFVDAFYDVGANYPFIQQDDVSLDDLSLGLVQEPERFDVLLLQNLYGDIISDLAAGLVGGLGVVPGANVGKHVAVFEAVHGTAPDIAGQGKANPLAVLMSAVLMLDHMGERRVADRVRASIDHTLAGPIRTGDLGGRAGTAEFTAALIDNLPR
jgi:isocitrate dehydrogenase (NAD+)